MLYSVVVRPERWGGPLEQLAGELAPALDMPSSRVSQMLARGAMTVEADLTKGQAERLAGAMSARGIPVDVVDGAGGIASLAPARPESPAAPQAPPRVSLFDEPDEQMVLVDAGADLPEVFDDLPSFDIDVESDDAPAEANPWADALGFGVEPVAEAAAATPEPEPGGWGTLFPDLGPGSDEPAPEPRTPSLTAPSPEPDFGASPALTPDFGASPATPAVPAEVEVPSTRASTPPPQVASTGIPGAPRYEPRPEPRPAARPEPAREPAESDDFDGVSIAEALGYKEKAPYAPDGFDDRVPHSVEFAAALSILAPGAGQLYNGDAEKASATLFWSFLIVPWVKSVPESIQRAKRIKDYYAPWPEEGTGKRVLQHVVSFYVVVACLGAFASWTMGKVEERAQRAERMRMAESRDAAIVEAARALLDASDEAAVVMEETHDEIESNRMPDDERANLLYERALPMCRAFEYESCLEAMKRVNELAPNHRDASRLQTWANFRMSGARIDFPKLTDAPVPGESPEEFDERVRDEDAGAPSDVDASFEEGSPDDAPGDEETDETEEVAP